MNKPAGSTHYMDDSWDGDSFSISLHRWERTEAGRRPRPPVYRHVRPGSWAHNPDPHSAGGTEWFWSSSRNSVLLNFSWPPVWCFSAFLGVWLSCTVARSEAADCSAEEPGSTDPGYYSGQPHGWVSYLCIISNFVTSGIYCFNSNIFCFCLLSQVFPDWWTCWQTPEK